MNIKKRFTRWYVRKGYKYQSDEPVYVCPWYIRPFAMWLLLPSVYTWESTLKAFRDLGDALKSVGGGEKDAP